MSYQLVLRDAGAGDMRSVRSNTIEQAERMLRPIPYAMPVGWASYGVNSYLCPECNR